MTVYLDKKRQKWRYDFEHKGRRYNGYCVDGRGVAVRGKRAAVAAEADARHRAEKAEVSIPPRPLLTLAQVMNDLTKLWRHGNDWPNKKRYVREILQFFGPTTAMVDIDEARIQNYIAFALAQPVMRWVGGSSRRPGCPYEERYWKLMDCTRAPATVNRYLPCLRMAFARAHKTKDKVTGARAIDDIPEIPDLPEPKRKARPTPEPVLAELIGILPQHVVEALTATLFFGFRQSEVFGLKTANVDFDAGGIRLDAEDVKDDEDAFLPGAPAAMDFMRRLVEQAKSRDTPYLFTWRRYYKDQVRQTQEPWRPIRRPKSAWRTAMKKISSKYGKRWRWHDLRAAFITQVALQSGSIAAQTLARHSDFATTQGYIEVADEFRRAAANRVAERPILALLNCKDT